MTAAITAPASKSTTTDRDSTLRLALLLVLAVIAFEQFLHTSPAAQAGSAGYEVMYWLSDALFALPFAMFAVWVGGRVANRLGFESHSVWGAFGRAGVIALAFGVLLIPGWFLHDDVDLLAHTAAIGSGHSHGSDEVHWAGDTVFRLLILVPLAAAALWGGERIGDRLARGRGLLARAGVIVVLLAVALTSAWFLEVAADAADSGQVTYANAERPMAHSHGATAHMEMGPGHVFMGPVSATASNSGGSPAADVAHALRDGLAGQAVGLPLMFVALLWIRARRRRSD